MRHLEGRSTALMLLAALLLGGCSPKEYSESTPINGEQGRAGALLAYEHELSLAMPLALLAPRMQATRQACESAQFGACNILRIEENSDGGTIVFEGTPSDLVGEGKTLTAQHLKDYGGG